MNSDYPDQSLLTVRNIQVDLRSPKVMGILNATPDSFSDGGKFTSLQKAIDRIGVMIEEGAHMIDVGGESTRPGAEPVSESEEADRVLPILQKAIRLFPGTVFSIDTTKYKIAEEALKTGVHIVNDVSGLAKEPRFAGLCGKYGAGYVLMHSQGDPKTMQKNPVYNDVITEISDFFQKKIHLLRNENVHSVIIDPGIGFGKTLQHNLRIIDGLKNFSTFRCPILVGASRKSMIGQVLEKRPVEGRLAGTIAIHYHCLLNGAGILRVHDVEEASDSIKIFNALKSIENN